MSFYAEHPPCTGDKAPFKSLEREQIAIDGPHSIAADKNFDKFQRLARAVLTDARLYDFGCGRGLHPDYLEYTFRRATEIRNEARKDAFYAPNVPLFCIAYTTAIGSGRRKTKCNQQVGFVMLQPKFGRGVSALEVSTC